MKNRLSRKTGRVMRLDTVSRHRRDPRTVRAESVVWRGPGRPKEMNEEARRTAVIDAAEHVFSTRGFSAATMDDIAQQARMSKKTIYALFEGKADLFLSLLRRGLPTPDQPELPGGKDASAEEHIAACLSRLAELALSQRKIALLRLVIGEATSNPSLAEMFSRELIEPGPYGLAACLKQAEREYGFTLDDPAGAMDMLVGMAIGGPLLKTLISDHHRLPEGQIHKRIRAAVRIFLSGMMASRQSPGSPPQA